MSRETALADLDRAWRAEERCEISLHATLARLRFARERVAARAGESLGLDGAEPAAVPTELAIRQQRELGEALASVGSARRELAQARDARRRARRAVPRRAGRG